MIMTITNEDDTSGKEREWDLLKGNSYPVLVRNNGGKTARWHDKTGKKWATLNCPWN